MIISENTRRHVQERSSSYKTRDTTSDKDPITTSEIDFKVGA